MYVIKNFHTHMIYIFEILIEDHQDRKRGYVVLARSNNRFACTDIYGLV